MANNMVLSGRNMTEDEKKLKRIVTRRVKDDTLEAKNKKIPQELSNLLAGGISGMVAKSFVAPMDRIKILYQVTNAQFRIRNVPRVAYTIVSQEGPTALWKGNTATMLRVFPYSGIQFMTYDMAKRYITSSKYCDGKVNNIEAEMTPLENLMAGMIAGTVSVLCTYPLDLVRAQLAVLVKDKKEMRTNHSVSSVLKSNINQRGFVGIFRGIGPTIIGMMPYAGLGFTINEQGKKRIRILTNREPTFFEKLQCGALSGFFAQSLTYPLEVTRRRMQTHGLISENLSGNLLTPGKRNKTIEKSNPIMSQVTMISTMKRLHIEEGLAGFFKGLTMNWIKGPITFGISFTTYDILKGFLSSNESFTPKFSNSLFNKDERR